MKQKVVIIGHGYTSRLGLIRSLGVEGYDITVVAIVFHNLFGRLVRLDGGRPIDCHSKYVGKVYYCQANDKKGLIDLLLKKCTDPSQKVVLIPDSDFSAAVIDSCQDSLRPHFLFPNINNRAGMVEYWMDKTNQKRLAQEVGLNVAQGITVSIKDGHFDMPTGVRYPCFTKPKMTLSGGKQFLCRCQYEPNLWNVLSRVAQKYDTEVLVEDYLDIDKEYAVVGFADGQNVVIPGVIEFLENSESHFGIARRGKIMPTEGFAPLLEQFRKFVSRIGFVGLFDIDFFRCGDSFWFGELNLRYGGSGYAYTAMGANLPAMLVRHLCGESYADLVRAIDSSAIYVNERMVLDDYLHGFINSEQSRAILRSADISFVENEADRGPQRKLSRVRTLSYLNRIRWKFKKNNKIKP